MFNQLFKRWVVVRLHDATRSRMFFGRIYYGHVH